MLSDHSKQWEKLLGLPADADSMQVCPAFEKLAIALAPRDLGDLSLYAMPISALPPEFMVASRHTTGWFHNLAYHWARPHLPDDRGSGPTIFVQDIRTEEAARNLAIAAQTVLAVGGEAVEIEELLEFVPPANTIETLCRVLLHELGHALDSLADGDFEMWDYIAELRSHKAPSLKRLDTSARFDDLVSESQSQTVQPPPQLHYHGLRFTRIIAHLDHRLQTAGASGGNYDAAGERFGQREYVDCFDALGNEMAKCRRKSFADILASPMPPAFEKCDLGSNEKAVA